MAEVERDQEGRVERLEQEQEEAVVPRAVVPGAHEQGAEPWAEHGEPFSEHVDPVEPAEERDRLRRLDREAKVGGRRVSPALELLLRGKAVEGVVQLHRAEPLGVVPEELLGLASAG